MTSGRQSSRRSTKYCGPHGGCVRSGGLRCYRCGRNYRATTRRSNRSCRLPVCRLPTCRWSVPSNSLHGVVYSLPFRDCNSVARSRFCAGTNRQPSTCDLALSENGVLISRKAAKISYLKFDQKCARKYLVVARFRRSEGGQSPGPGPGRGRTRCVHGPARPLETEIGTAIIANVAKGSSATL